MIVDLLCFDSSCSNRVHCYIITYGLSSSSVPIAQSSYSLETTILSATCKRERLSTTSLPALHLSLRRYCNKQRRVCSITMVPGWGCAS